MTTSSTLLSKAIELLSSIELKVSLHINTQCLKSSFLLLDYSAFDCTQQNKFLSGQKATYIAFKAMYMGIPVSQTAEH